MTLPVLALAVVLAAPTPVERRFNVEPVAIGAAGLLLLGAGVWRLVVANGLWDDFQRFNPPVMTPEEAATALAAANDFRDRGRGESRLSATLFVMGGVALVSSVLWLLLEGFDTEVTHSLAATAGGVALRF